MASIADSNNHLQDGARKPSHTPKPADHDPFKDLCEELMRENVQLRGELADKRDEVREFKAATLARLDELDSHHMGRIIRIYEEHEAFSELEIQRAEARCEQRLVMARERHEHHLDLLREVAWLEALPLKVLLFALAVLSASLSWGLHCKSAGETAG